MVDHGLMLFDKVTVIMQVMPTKQQTTKLFVGQVYGSVRSEFLTFIPAQMFSRTKLTVPVLVRKPQCGGFNTDYVMVISP